MARRKVLSNIVDRLGKQYLPEVDAVKIALGLRQNTCTYVLPSSGALRCRKTPVMPSTSRLNVFAA